MVVVVVVVVVVLVRPVVEYDSTCKLLVRVCVCRCTFPNDPCNLDSSSMYRPLSGPRICVKDALRSRSRVMEHNLQQTVLRFLWLLRDTKVKTRLVQTSTCEQNDLANHALVLELLCVHDSLDTVYLNNESSKHYWT